MHRLPLRIPAFASFSLTLTIEVNDLPKKRYSWSSGSAGEGANG